MRWGDIALGTSEEDTNRYIHVRRSITERGNIGLPKGNKDRKVDLPLELRRTILAHQMSEFVKGRGKPDDWCFCRPDGRFLAERTMQKALKRILVLSALSDIRFHDLRHSFATIHLRELRSPIQWVSAQLGHSSIKITIDLYGHPEVETDVAVADRLGQAMTPSSQPSEAPTQERSAQQSATYPQPKTKGACKSLTHKPQDGGGGGNRTPVRRGSPETSTCLSGVFEASPPAPPHRQGHRPGG